jgi:SAM-dependent methyltransferase
LQDLSTTAGLPLERGADPDIVLELDENCPQWALVASGMIKIVPMTDGVDYTDRLARLEGVRWKRIFDVQAPYRWNLRRLNLGRTLDVGCGIGRNLINLAPGSIGVDHNPTSVAACLGRGLMACTPREFFASGHAQPAAFDSMLAAHVVEHMPEADARELLAGYLACVRPGGAVVIITPQERGYASDSTHVRFVGFAEAASLCTDLELTVFNQYSFPLPRAAGSFFTHNEFVTVALLARDGAGPRHPIRPEKADRRPEQEVGT